MPAIAVNPPFPLFTDADGQPLDDAYIYIGTANQNPVSNPITVYWDAALTVTAAQPIRTSGGYPVYNGSPARFYSDSDYSILVRDKNGAFIYTAASETDLISSQFVTFIQLGTGAAERTVQDKLRDVISVKDFGAVGDGVTDDTAAIQAAIDYATSLAKPAEVIIPSGNTYILNVATRTGIAAGVAGLVMRDNVTLVINGTLKAKANIYGPGTLSALIKSPDVGNTGSSITGSGTIDGNRSNQLTSTQCDNIYLRAVSQVSVNGIKCINANGNGILIDKAVSGSNHTNVAVTNTVVVGCNTIGIQVSHSAANLVIANNRVSSCTNNCIDVYDENGTVTPDPGVISITGNTVSGGLVGIFPETVANCSVVGNAISGCTYAGISTNRVNGAPSNIVISGNNIWSCPNGIVGSGDTNGVLITGNTISAFNTNGILLSGITVSSYTVHGNIFIPSATTTPIITISGTTLIWNQIFNNVCNDASHNPAFGLVRSGSGASNTFEPIIYSPQIRPVKNSASGNTTSGGTSTITVPASTAGKLLISSSAGGAWNTVWAGSFVSAASRVSVAQNSTTFTSPGNGITSVAGSASTLDITITWAASGSSGFYIYWIEYL